MIGKFAAVALVLALALPGAGRAQEVGGGDAAAIRAVILDQIEAFRAGEMERAFAHAAPGIQSIFRTPERFGRMVETGYPMIWRPRSVDAGTLARADDRVVQTMVFVDSRGRVFEADYEMRRVIGVWRIAGVELRRLPGVGS